MAQESWPRSTYNSGAVTEAEYERLAQRFTDDGVYGPGGSNFFDDTPIVAGSGLQVLVRPDWYGSVRGFVWYSGTVEDPVAVPNNNGTGGVRQDWVVLRLDRSTWQVRAAIRQGTPGAGPPALVQNPGPTGVYEIQLALIRVPVGASSLTDADVTPYPLFVGTRVRPSGGGLLGRNQRPEPGEISWSQDLVEQFDGTSWTTILEDTGWLPMSLVNTDGFWSSQAPGQWCRRLNGQVFYEINTRREGTNLQTDSSDASQGSHLVTLPAGFRPKRELHKPLNLTAGITARLRIKTNGEMYLQAPSSTVGPGRYVRVADSFPIG